MLLSTVKASLPVVHIVPPSAILIRNHLKCVEHAVNYRVQPVVHKEMCQVEILNTLNLLI